MTRRSLIVLFLLLSLLAAGSRLAPSAWAAKSDSSDSDSPSKSAASSKSDSDDKSSGSTDSDSSGKSSPSKASKSDSSGKSATPKATKSDSDEKSSSSKSGSSKSDSGGKSSSSKSDSGSKASGSKSDSSGKSSDSSKGDSGSKSSGSKSDSSKSDKSSDSSKSDSGSKASGSKSDSSGKSADSSKSDKSSGSKSDSSGKSSGSASKSGDSSKELASAKPDPAPKADPADKPAGAASATAAKAKVVLVKADEATMRAEASAKGKSVDTLPQFAPVQVQGIEDKYTKVQVGDKSGYILTSSLSDTPFVSTKLSGDDHIKVRATAASDAQELMTLGTAHYPLRVLEKDGKRAKVVDCDGDGGWVHESYLSFDRYVIAIPPAGQGEWINLRDKPGLDKSGKALGTKRFSAQKGTIFQVLEEKDGWLHVKYIVDGDEGWCSANVVWGWSDK